MGAEFFFVRHGQTDYNLQGDKVDHDDVPLNATGKKQAQAIAPLIRKLPLQSVCFSPKLRAKETKDLITENCHLLHHEIPDLTECSQQVWNDMVAAKNGFPDHVEHFLARVKLGLERALRAEGPVLIVAHGGIHWALCSHFNIQNHPWIIDNCIPVHFLCRSNGEWTVKILYSTHL